MASGDGFVTVADGTHRWGRFGAAGVLVRHTDPDDGRVRYFLQLRSLHSHQGGTWAIPGGALDSDESPEEGALREFREEIRVPMPPYRVLDVHEDDHGGWSYWTVVVEVPERFDPPTDLHWETADVAWVDADDVADLPLHPAFRATMVRLGALPA